VSNQTINDDGASVGLVVFEVEPDGTIPVDFVVSGAIGAGGTIEAAPHGLHEGVGEFAFQFLHDISDDLAGGVFCFFGDDLAQ
jgi:hypothetical protein